VVAALFYHILARRNWSGVQGVKSRVGFENLKWNVLRLIFYGLVVARRDKVAGS